MTALSASSLIIFIAAAAGTLLASYIRYKKVSYQPLVCPLRSNCEAVTHSQFSTFFGIPVEVLGIIYYSLTALCYAALLLLPTTNFVMLQVGLASISASAFLFSLYLTFIQAVSLRQWCTWCLCSAGLCTVIFSISFINNFSMLTAILTEYYSIVLSLHLLGLAIGLGGATVADTFFFKFLKDLRISLSEAEVLRFISQIIWVGVSILVLSGIGLFIPQADTLLHSPKFLVKVTVVSIIIINGAFLNLYIAPKLLHISFGRPNIAQSRALIYQRKLAFALGAVSMTSWYTAFILGFLRSVSLSYGQLLTLYLLAVAIAITGSQIMEMVYGRRKMDLKTSTLSLR